jgi:ubiquinone/menaquinone biosynthesis C-methylase UbiE
MSNFDFGRYSDDYAAYRPGYPESLYERLDAIAPIRESRSLDLATGPGTIALELARRGSAVVGIDISTELVATARRVAKEWNVEDRLRFTVANAEQTGLDAGAFDLVTAGQCWHGSRATP